jgi:hypothetical protein
LLAINKRNSFQKLAANLLQNLIIGFEIIEMLIAAEFKKK